MGLLSSDQIGESLKLEVAHKDYCSLLKEGARYSIHFSVAIDSRNCKCLLTEFCRGVATQVWALSAGFPVGYGQV